MSGSKPAPPRRAALAAIAALIASHALVLSSPAAAQRVTVEELERQLKALEAEEQRQRQPAPARQRPAVAQTAELVIRTDAPCRLTVGGSDLGALSAGGSRSHRVPVGTVTVACVAAEAEGIAFSQNVETVAFGQHTVDIRLAAEISEAQAPCEIGEVIQAVPPRYPPKEIRDCIGGLTMVRVDVG